MIIKTITYIERKNLGNFEFAELTSTAELKEGEDEVVAVEKLIAFVQASLKTETLPLLSQEKYPVKETNIAEQVEPSFSNSVIEAPKKEKKSKKSTYKFVESVPETTIVEEAPKKPAIVYNSNVAEHKSILGGYLSKKYDNAWKTAKPTQEIKDFTASLNGEEFVDTDGKIVDSFLELIHGFFGS